MSPRPRPARAGISLIELLIVLSILAIAITKVSILVSSTSESTGRKYSGMVLETQARTVIDRIALAVMGSDRESLNPFDTPLYTTSIAYRVSLGVDENGDVVWAAAEEVGLEDEGRQVTWKENPGELDERRVVWTNLVRPFLENEQGNGADDNGNGFVDEEGLVFMIDGTSVLIRLTMSRVDDQGEWGSITVERTVTCRN
ncbi:MAG: type II secretion system protein [Planctomycetota bacterium]